MKKVILSYAILLLSAWHLKAQSLYSASQYELIFSWGNVNTTTIRTLPVVRFTAFFNCEEQVHKDFSKAFGLYSGLGIKNVGMIQDFDDYNVNFKQRSYALSVPLAIKLGNMKKQKFVALGAEMNFMFHYKQKFLFGKTKIKESEWLSDKINLWNPAAFVQVKLTSNTVLTFKYFLKNYLRYQSAGLTLPDGTLMPDYGRTSTLYYISIGTNIKRKTKKEKEQEYNEIKTAGL